MQLVVNHLTRMKGDRICVAGIDPATGAHIRPVTTADAPLARRHLHEHGGPFEIGALVELGSTTPCGERPTTEDHRFVPHHAQRLRRLDDHEYIERLHAASVDSLQEAFGDALVRETKWKCAIPVGSGTRSLAVVRPAGICRVEADDKFKPKVSLRFSYDGDLTYAPVTDLRLFESDQQTIRRSTVEDIDARLRRGVDVILMLGLSRPFEDDPDHHWLQVNGLCLADRPVTGSP